MGREEERGGRRGRKRKNPLQFVPRASLPCPSSRMDTEGYFRSVSVKCSSVVSDGRGVEGGGWGKEGERGSSASAETTRGAAGLGAERVRGLFNILQYKDILLPFPLSLSLSHSLSLRGGGSAVWGNNNKCAAGGLARKSE